MKLCIPIADAGGLSSALDPDFGAARYLVIVDTESGATLTVDRHQPEQVTDEAVAGIAAVLCGVIHPRLLHELQHNGIQVFGSDGPTAELALAQFRAGELHAAAPAGDCHEHAGDGECCGGRGHAHGAGEHDEKECCGRGGHEHGGGCGHRHADGHHHCACDND